MNVENSPVVVRSERRGRVGIVTIDRPERRNALNLQVKQDLVAQLQALEQDEGISAIVLTGSGGYFVAGTDIAEMAGMRPGDHVRLETDRVFHVVRQLANPRPTLPPGMNSALNTEGKTATHSALARSSSGSPLSGASMISRKTCAAFSDC